MIIDKELCHSIKDIRRYRGVGSHSDHFLVKVKIAMKIPSKWNKKLQQQQWYDIDKMKRHQVVIKEYAKSFSRSMGYTTNLSYQEHNI